MAQPTIWQRIRSLFSHAASTTWPGATRPIARRLVAWTLLIAIVHLAVCTVLAHPQLKTSKQIECWDIDSEADLHQLALSDKEIGTTFKKLPVTFVNMDVLAGWKEASGPKYLYLGSPNWKVAVATSLFFIPLCLVLFLAWHLLVHIRSGPLSQRTAMLFATLFWIQFFIDNSSILLLHNFPTRESGVYHESCWRGDGTMRALAHAGRWAQRVRIAGIVVGWLGIACMMAYFFCAHWAALDNRIVNEQEPVPLADLSGLVTNPRDGQGGNVNIARPAATGASPSAQATANVGPKSAIAPLKPVVMKQGQPEIQLKRPQGWPLKRLQESEMDRLEREFEELRRQMERPQNRQENELDRLEREFERLETQLENQIARHAERHVKRHAETEQERQGNYRTNEWTREFQRKLIQDIHERREREQQIQERRTEENANPFTDPRNLVT